MNILICDTEASAIGEAAFIAAYLTAKYAANAYVVRGVNDYYCTLGGTQVLQQADIDAADVIIFAKDYHYQYALNLFPQMNGNPLASAPVTRKIYKMDDAGDITTPSSYPTYLTKVELKLLPIL